LATVALVLFLGIIALGIVGPEITPYEYNETLYDESGQLLDTQSPSLAHPLGTTSNGHDVLSRVMYGARPTVITGLLGGSMIIGIGMTIGVTAGYLGGRVENTLMRFTDFVYGVPLIPFAIVLLSLLGFNFYTSIIVIGAILWRGNARVLRSQVLQIKERPFILSAKATGASSARIVLKHILPNIAPMAFLFFALGIGYAILVQASLAFIGVTNPFVPSWGIMIRNAYNSGLMTVAWWWAITPGILISLTVMSAFVLGRRLEAVSGDGDGQSFAEAG
jgi:peptide/nickel transport system permease protein